MAVYCSKCGHRHDRPMPFCPSCGTKMAPSGGPSSILPANVGPGATTPIHHERESHGILVGLIASAVTLALAIGLFVHSTQAPTCAEAGQMIQQHHEFIFGAMNVAGMPVRLDCPALAINPVTETRYASADWTFNGTTYRAGYWVDRTGAVSPANLTAGELDRAASSGVNALLSLLR